MLRSLLQYACRQPVVDVFADPACASAVDVYGGGKLAVFDCVVDAGAAHGAEGEDVLKPQQPTVWRVRGPTRGGAAVVESCCRRGVCHFLAVIL